MKLTPQYNHDDYVHEKVLCIHLQQVANTLLWSVLAFKVPTEDHQDVIIKEDCRDNSDQMIMIAMIGNADQEWEHLPSGFCFWWALP